MVRIRPREQPRPEQPAAVPGPDAAGVSPESSDAFDAPDEFDALVGVEAFGPRDDDDPFAKVFTEDRPVRADGEGGSALVGAGLVLALVVLLSGVLSIGLGIADDDGDDLATVPTTSSTSTTARQSIFATTSTTTSSRSVTSTTLVGLTPGTTLQPGTSTPTTRRPTVTTVRPATTLPVGTTTTVAPNEPLTISIGVDPAEPTAGQAFEVTVIAADPDAVPTDNCQVVKIDGVVRFPDDGCTDQPCDGGPPEGTGGRRELHFGQILAEGTHTIEVTARSGRPECGERYADEVTTSITVTIAA